MTDFYLTGLSLETTRRCNMNCIHCAKGAPQNLDISKDIIDRSINELKNAYINTLEIIGGETFLNIDGFEYAVDSLIKNKIKVNQVFLFTNGTIKNMRIVKAIQKLADYLKGAKPLFKNNIKKYRDKYSCIKYRYETDVENKDIIIIVSTNYHKNKKMINDTIYYYNSKINKDNSIALSQDEDFFLDNVYLNFEGNLIKNYKSIPDEAIKRIRIVDNNYCILDDSTSDTILINKTITISANGNVFVGNLSSYKKVDNQITMFNILDCTNNFLPMISNWCWLNPLTEKMHSTKESYNKFLFLKKENKLDNDELISTYSKINIDYGLSYCENTLKKIHNEYPDLTHSEVETAFNCWLLIDIAANTDIEKELILELFSSFKKCEHKEIINNYSHSVQIAKKTLIKLCNE